MPLLQSSTLKTSLNVGNLFWIDVYGDNLVPCARECNRSAACGGDAEYSFPPGEYIHFDAGVFIHLAEE